MACIADIETTPTLQPTSASLDLAEGVPPLNTLYLYVAGACNLACQHCWITPSFRPDGVGGNYLALEHVEKAIRESLPLGLKSVKLTGGEPLLHPQIRDIVSLAHQHGLGISIETNGTLVDDSLALFLKEKKVGFISVSLDGAKAATHEYLRNVPGSYARAIDGIASLVSAGFHPQLICTLHQGNVQEIDEIVTLAQDMGCGSVKFNHVQPSGRGEQFSNKMGLSIAEVIQIYQRLEQDLRPQFRIPIYIDIPPAFQSVSGLLSERNQCKITNILGILAGGELSMCGIGVTVSDLIYGNLAQDNIHDVWHTNATLRQLRQDIPDHLDGICQQCIHHHICRGRCLAQSYLHFGRINAPYPFCASADELGLFPASRKV